MNNKNNKQPAQASGKKASKAFWATILFLVFATLSVVIYSYVFGNINLSEDDLKRHAGGAAEAAYNEVYPEIDDILNTVYEPVYQAIPEYVSFHYSIVGEYIELLATAKGTVKQDIEEQLFDGFDERLLEEYNFIGLFYEQEFSEKLDEGLKNELQGKFGSFGASTKQAINETKSTIKQSTLNMASLAGGGKVVSVSAVLAGKITAKLTAKLATKATIKGAGALSGAVAGASVGTIACSWAGPFAALCGAGGAVVGWFLIDGAVVNVSEYFNSGAFETSLREDIDKHKQAISEQIKTALQDIAIENGASEDSFTLQNLSTSK